MVRNISELLAQVRTNAKAKFETNSKDKWLLLREEWDEHFCEEDHFIVLKQAGLPLEHRPLATYSHSEKKQIAASLRDLLAFLERYRALCIRRRKLFYELSREFPK